MKNHLRSMVSIESRSESKDSCCIESFRFWGLLALLVFAGVLETARAQSSSITFVQAAASTTSAAASSSSLSFSTSTRAGDLILVGFDYDTHATPSSVVDSQGNVFTAIGSQLTSPAGARSRVYYAKNIKGGPDTVTVKLSANSGWIEVYLTEYAGTNPASPIDAVAGSSGNSSSVSSGNITTTVPGDFLYAYCVGDWACSASSSFVTRSHFDDNLIEDRLAANAGTYSATATANKGWTIQMVALKPAIPAAQAPPTITSASTAAGTVGVSFKYQIAATNTPTSYGATGLPSGLSVNTTTGLISGTATTAGTSTVALSATNGRGTGKSNLSLSILKVAAPAITSSTSANGTTGKSFSYQITATNNPTSFGASGLPSGLSVNTSTGLVSGAPASAGTWTTALRAANSGGTGTADLKLTVSAVAIAPTLTTQPASVTVTAGQAATFTVATTGTAPFSYQWKRNGTTITSATSASYTTPTTTTSQNGSTFNVVVSNSAGSVTSKSATLTVNAAAQGQFIVLSSNGKYLVKQSTAQPVFLVAEQGFDLDQNLSDSDLETYLSDRAAKGFNLIWIAAIENSYSAHPPLDSQGNAPFNGSDFTNMNPTYFAQLDYVLNRMAAHGISALLGAAFSGSPCTTNPPINPSGYCHSMENTSDATLTAYGQYLGNRYKSFPNIIWLIGGDMDSTSNLVQKHNDIATGIRSADTVHLMTAQNIRGQSTLDVWTGYPWIRGINSIYSLPANIPSMTNSNYTRKDFLPEFLVEDWCENEHQETPLGLRTEGYWAVLSGAYLGRQFCNNPIWAFASGWQVQLSSPGSVSQSLLGKLFRSREHWLLVPDITHSVVTAGYGSGSTLTTTARTSDGQSIIAYIPNGHAATLTVDMTKITSSTSTVQGWWYDPQTGSTVSLGTFANSGTRSFTPPDTNDWVLVLDDAAAKLSAPGTSVATIE